MRIEKDFIGEVQIPKNALYGVHSLRAQENFPDTTDFHVEWFKALAIVKKACYLTAKDFLSKAGSKYDLSILPIKLPEEQVLNFLIQSAGECEDGQYYKDFIVPAISGGAGTSINLNINEILTNLSLQKLGHKPGSYQYIDPVEDANVFQSTNDVVPTALRVASMKLLNTLEIEINHLRSAVESKEKEYRNVIRIAYTQMQEAVPTTYGKLFSSYSDALSRDWWRISKCLERIKVVNLGGSAIGTSIAVPNYFVVEVVKTLQQISDLPVTRGENLSDTTSNLDAFVEVHGILKAHAVNLEKMVNDLRLLSSDIHGEHKIHIPKKQTGSSIMPGKVNPVIPEFVISSVHRIYANDQLISGLSAQGCLELNAYLPTIGHAMLESLKLLIACNSTCRLNLIEGIEIDKEAAGTKFAYSPSTVTMLIPYIGYNKSSELAKHMQDNKLSIFEANDQLELIAASKLKEILKPENLIKGGFKLKDFEEE